MRGSRLGLFRHEINKKKLQFILKRNIDISLDRTNFWSAAIDRFSQISRKLQEPDFFIKRRSCSKCVN